MFTTKYSRFEIEFRINYIHKLLFNRLDNYITYNLNLRINSLHKFEEGIFAELNNLNVIGIIPINSNSIYSSISQPFQIKDFTFEKEHVIHKILAKKNNFVVEFDNIKYFIDFEKEDTIFKKSLDLSITRFNYHDCIPFLLVEELYYHIRRRLYNNIICINKLKDGLIRKYEVFNQFELEALKQYLTNKNILFSIIENNPSYTRKYNMLDKTNKYCFQENGYPEQNKVCKPSKLYIKVYKGYVNLSEIKEIKHKYGIYLY